ncbi:MAG: 30S ribosomal protein S12 methylthiotransferase RimO [Cyclobacteriaceae bacterium]|nr:30S ribosomal protein S12 methylthiotransferase RimO [Cyclobacteriaceae bacterium]
MKTKGTRKYKVNVVTMGCAKNLVDSEVLITQLKANKINVYHEKDNVQSDIVIVNTCGFIENAKQESIDTILNFVKAKKQGLIQKLYVTGCLSQRYREELETEIPQVDAYFGTRDLPALLKRFNVDYRHELLGERLTSTRSHYAYLKISEGCDRPCSFCAIPLMRGNHRSRPVEELVQEASFLAERGVKELLLIAQDSTYYGIDLYNTRMLGKLMDSLAKIDRIEWIRLHYAFPAGFPEDALHIMADNENICKYIDMPLQHASSKMLKIMRRGITRERTEALIEKIRNLVPGIGIRTTMLVGHPGETGKDFEEMIDFIEKVKFDRLGVFTYSHEEGTHSWSLKDTVPKREKQRRADELMEVQASISGRLNQQRIGKILKVIIDRKENGHYIGRTEYDSPEVDNEVLIDAGVHKLRTGEFSSIFITDALPFDLIGKPHTGDS